MLDRIKGPGFGTQVIFFRLLTLAADLAWRDPNKCRIEGPGIQYPGPAFLFRSHTFAGITSQIEGEPFSGSNPLACWIERGISSLDRKPWPPWSKGNPLPWIEGYSRLTVWPNRKDQDALWTKAVHSLPGSKLLFSLDRRIPPALYFFVFILIDFFLSFN